MSFALRAALAIALLTVLAAPWVLSEAPEAQGMRVLWGRWPAAVVVSNLAVSYAVAWALRALWTRDLRATLLECALCSGSAALLLVLLELPAVIGFNYGAHLGLPEHMRFTRVKPWNNPSNLRDPEVIFRHKPHLRFVGSTPGDLVPLYGIATERRYVVDVRYDHRGFRNDTDFESADLVLIGDSFIEAGLVPASDLVSSRLAAELGVVVANLGVSGYGPQQELIVLRRYGLPLAPRLAIWFFFEGNDLIDVARYRRFQQDPEGYLQSDDSFRKRSLLSNAFSILSVLTEPAWERDTPLARWRSCGFPSASGRTPGRLYFAYEGSRLGRAELAQFAVAKRTFEKARAICNEDGIHLLLVYVPIKFRVFESVCEIAPDSLLARWRSHDLPRRMRRFASERGIPFLDLTPSLQEAAEEGVAAYFPDDGHWNSEGHALVSRELADFARERLGF